ncbi:TonB-dependent receptor domain-containing protein [uncultured Draconibacterium sp.]|uniref:TonB-dependent receptor n=1 Tax=uncultured Draconibacterium sp. TaxID=1573823 RepID=UPI002AA6FF84|nr:TonB-dependent receptor [uncultured Draconibacterium sp.]
MRRFVYILSLILLGGGLFAQEESVMDTVILEEVSAYGDYVKFQTGAKIEQISPKQLSVSQEGGLEQVLMRYTPIYIRTDAGGLSTIHIRGTAADHTSVMFGGINVNSLTLGHSNLSNITTFLFDKLDLQYGSSAALNGSGAVGGAIYLGQRNSWTNGLRADAKITYGSFGERMYGTKVYVGNGKWESVTKLLSYSTDNDFKFQNPYHNHQISNPGPVEDTQHGAAIDNKGIMQQFNYLFGANEYLKSMFWYEDSWHQVQPNMQQNYTYTSSEELSNKNFRAWVEYKNENKRLKYNLGAGYVHDKQVYDADESQKIQTDRLVTDFSLKYPLGKKMELKSGMKFKHIVPTVYSYSDSVIDYEQHLDFYFAWYYKPTKRLKATVNLRQQFVTDYEVPFTPALGLEYQILSGEKSKLKAFVNASKSYRVPTFNDRFWGNQGDPDLDPEDGMSYETGVEHNWNGDWFSSKFRTNVFYMNIENWIEWRSKGVWVPFNLEKVVTKGVEVMYNSHFDLGKFASDFTANYTYNPAIKMEENRPDQQLIHTPKNMANASYMLGYRAFTFFIDGSYYGKRFFDYAINDEQLANRGSLDAYSLVNCGLSYQLNVKDQQFDCSFSANNIFNKDYQNQRYYAMPGINFRLSIAAKINVINNNN